jgi:hypothetical protein
MRVVKSKSKPLFYRREDFIIIQNLPENVVYFSDLHTWKGCIYNFESKDGETCFFLHFHFSPSRSSHGRHCNLGLRGIVSVPHNPIERFFPLWGEYDKIPPVSYFIDSVIQILARGEY